MLHGFHYKKQGHFTHMTYDHSFVPYTLNQWYWVSIGRFYITMCVFVVLVWSFSIKYTWLSWPVCFVYAYVDTCKDILYQENNMMCKNCLNKPYMPFLFFFLFFLTTIMQQNNMRTLYCIYLLYSKPVFIHCPKLVWMLSYLYKCFILASCLVCSELTCMNF